MNPAPILGSCGGRLWRFTSNGLRDVRAGRRLDADRRKSLCHGLVSSNAKLRVMVPPVRYPRQHIDGAVGIVQISGPVF